MDAPDLVLYTKLFHSIPNSWWVTTKQSVCQPFIFLSPLIVFLFCIISKKRCTVLYYPLIGRTYDDENLPPKGIVMVKNLFGTAISFSVKFWYHFWYHNIAARNNRETTRNCFGFFVVTASKIAQFKGFFFSWDRR